MIALISIDGKGDLMKGNIFVKRGIWIFLLLFVVSGITYGEMVLEEWTLEECINWSLENHPQLVIYSYDLQEAQWELQKIQLEDQQRIAQKELEQTIKTVNEATSLIEEKKIQLIMDVQTGYYQVLRAIQTLKGKERQMEWIDKQYQIVQVKYEGGLIPEKDWIAMQERMEQMEEDYKSTCFSLETSQMELNLTMGRGLEEDLILPADEQFSFETVQVDFEESLSSTFEHDSGIADLRHGVEQAREELELQKKLQVAHIELQKLEHALAKAEVQLKLAEDQMVIRVRNTYRAIKDQERGVEQGKRELEQAKKDLQVLKVKYDAGMISLLELLDGQSNLADAETKGIQAIYDYNLGKNSFYQMIGKKNAIRQYLLIEGQE